MKSLISLLIVCFFSFTACRKDKTDNTGSNNQPVQLNSYPLAIGNSWKYYTESHIADSTGVNFLNAYYDNYWEVVSDTTINGSLCAKISQIDSNYNGSVNLDHTYYTNKTDGLYALAVENHGSSIFFKTTDFTGQTQFNFPGPFGNTILATDTVFIPDTSLRLLSFPSNVNDIWLSYEYNKPVPDIIKRKWIAYKTITTSAGTFNCIKLQMFWDRDNNNLPDSGSSEVYQYFSTKGLIQEEWNAALINNGGSIDSFHRITKLVQINF